MKCVETAQTNKGLPGWGIALIIFLILLAVGVALYFIRRCLKSRKENKNSEGNVELPPSSDRQRAFNSDNHGAKESIEHFKNK
jgi:flagellar basal body-associated protein FliL